MQEFLNSLTPQEPQRALPPSYETECRLIEQECKHIFRDLPPLEQEGLRAGGLLCFVAAFAGGAVNPHQPKFLAQTSQTVQNLREG